MHNIEVLLLNTAQRSDNRCRSLIRLFSTSKSVGRRFSATASAVSSLSKAHCHQLHSPLLPPNRGGGVATTASSHLCSSEKSMFLSSSIPRRLFFSFATATFLLSAFPASALLPSSTSTAFPFSTEVSTIGADSSLPTPMADSTATLTVANGDAAAVSEPQNKKRLETFRHDYKPPNFDITDIDMVVHLHDTETKVESSLIMKRHEGTDLTSDLLLDGDELKLEALFVNGVEMKSPFDYTYNEHAQDGSGSLWISSKHLPKNADHVFTVSTTVKISPSTNFRLMGLYKTGPIYCTQCEADGFRRITYYIDRPDVMATMKVKIIGNKESCPILLSNGNLLEKGDVLENSSLHYALFDDPHPKPSYLFALVAGQLHSITDSHTTKSGKKVHLEIFSQKEDVAKLHWAMSSLKKAMVWDEEQFGLEYDLSNFYIVCVRDFNHGAMENKGLNIFNTAVLLADEYTTDSEYKRILDVVGHEYFHNWTGDRVTCQDWFQLTLKEGLTVYREFEFSSDMFSRGQKRVEDMRFMKSRQFSADGQALSHPIRPESYIAVDNFYTTTVYEKGAEVIRMYATILTKEGFRRGMDLYFKRHDGCAVTCDDFRMAMSDANNVDLTQFELWYSQAGTPVVEVVESEFLKEKKAYKLTLTQMTPPTPNQPIKLPLHIPVVLNLISKKTKTDLLPENIVFHLKEAKQTIEIPNVEDDCVPSILREFSAPVKLVNKFETDEMTAFRMAYDSDDVNRYEAAEKFFTKIILERASAFKTIHDEIVKNLQQGLSIDNSYSLFDNSCEVLASQYPAVKKMVPLFIKSFQSSLSDENRDMALQAYSLSVPDFETVAQHIVPLDPLILYKTLRSVGKEIATELKADIYNKYQSATVGPDYEETLSSNDVGRRKLRNTMLSYICSARNEESATIAFEHYQNSKSFTDKLAAVVCLASFVNPWREHVLAELYEKAKDAHLLLDKWFAIQASSDKDDVLNDVKQLENHPDFNMKNPNRFRALYFSFAANTKLHRTDGEGYAFVADKVIAADKVNAHLAAGLCQYLINWKKLDGDYQTQMKKHLQRIYETPGISGETYEICHKGLKE